MSSQDPPAHRSDDRSSRSPSDGSPTPELVAALQAVIDLLPHLVWIKDNDGRYVAVNHFYANRTGRSAIDEIIGLTDHDIFPAHIADAFVANDRHIRESRRAQLLAEQVVIPPDEQVRHLEAHKGPIIVDGEVIGTVGFAHDVTDVSDLGVADEDGSPHQFRLMEALPFDLIRYDRNCRRVFVNRHFRQRLEEGTGILTGQSPEETWSDSSIGMSPADYQQRLREVLATGRPQAFELGSAEHGVLELVRLIPECGPTGEVVSVLMVGVDISELAEYRAMVSHLAHHDSLTNMPNRSMFRDRVAAAAAMARRHGTMYGVLILDIDRFKAINDGLGHGGGDQMLVQLAERLRACVRPYDLVARLGGDEFAVLMDDVTSLTDIRRLAERLRATFEEPFEIDGRQVASSMSIGIAAYPHDGEDAADLLRAADSAMHEAKRLGRDNIQMYSEELSRSFSERVAVERELRSALENGELSLAFQPIVTLQGEVRIAATEALLRWTNPTLGFVSPGVFIPIAEETGLIAPIGRWVFEEACSAAIRINAGRRIPILVSANVSARQFTRDDLVEQMRRTLEATGCDPRWIKVEITESVLMEDEAHTRAALVSMSEMGIRIAIDDFGTGFSSLSYLAAFPSDVVKIDRSFVNEITTDEPTQHVVRAVIGMATNLQKELVAEGIETAEQATLLTEWGCHRGQGYHFARPMPFDQLLTAIADDDTRHT